MARRQIGEVAELVGLSLRTIRHYDEMGLVPPSARTKGGFRLYTDRDVARLKLIKRMKPLGFSLEEMGDLLSVVDELELPRVEPERRGYLVGRLSMYLDASRGRAQTLREQVAMAEEFSGQLEEQLAQHTAGRPAAVPETPATAVSETTG